MPLDWEFLGLQLLERDHRPVILLDASGRVVQANRAFLFLLADGALGRHTSFRDDWLAEPSRLGFSLAFQRALAGERPRHAVTLARSLFPVDVVLELVRVGEGESAAVLGVMVEARSRGAALPVRPVTGITYEVSLTERGPGSTVKVAEAGPSQGELRPGPCWMTIFGRDGECPDCPVRKLNGATRATGVLQATRAAFAPTLLVSERRSPTTAAVTAIELDADAYGKLVNARVAHLAERARLTTRERDLLALLALGRSPEEVAKALGITARTAKFHQQNLLRKVGADSRLDLFRLLM